MSKRPLLHFKFELNKVKPDIIDKFAKCLSKRYGKNYRFMFTPFDLSVPNDDAPVLNFNGIDFTYDQIDEAIKDYMTKGEVYNE